MRVDDGNLRHLCDDPVCPDPVWQLSKGVSITRKGTNGVSTNGVSANYSFLTRTFWVITSVHRLLYSKKCQGVLFPQSVNKYCFCSGPISVDPICPQPTYSRVRLARSGYHACASVRAPLRRVLCRARGRAGNITASLRTNNQETWNL